MFDPNFIAFSIVLAIIILIAKACGRHRGR
jgi:hypothetical protein